FQVGVAAAATVQNSGVAQAAPIELKCGCDLPLDQPASVRLGQMWTAVNRESRGRLHVQFFPNASLGNMTAMFSQVRLGALSFLVAGSANLASIIPVADISSLGFAFKDADEGIRVMGGPLGNFIRQESQAKGIHVLPAFWIFAMIQIGSN